MINMKKTLVALAATATILAFTPTEYTPFSMSTAEASQSQHSFFETYGPVASNVANENDLYASVMLAQMALESNFGKSGLSRAPINNLFGIKGSYNGQSISIATKEDDGSGNLYSIIANFRKYPSAEDSMKDYVRLLQKPIYSGTKKSSTTTYHEVTNSLQGTYATDTQYASKINNIIKMYNLTKFDNGNNAVTAPKENETPISDAHEKVMSFVEFEKHEVVSGDTLFKLSEKYGVTVDYLISVNKLNSDLIYVGQILNVKEKEIPKEEYVIKEGDTLNKIAEEYETTADQLKYINDYNSDLIYAGETMMVPKKTKEEKEVTKELAIE